MRPLLPLLIAFSAGIAASVSLGLPYPAAYALIAASLILIFSAYILGLRFTPLLSAPAFFFLGVLSITPYLRPELPHGHVKNLIEKGARREESKEGRAVFRDYTDLIGVVAGR